MFNRLLRGALVALAVAGLALVQAAPAAAQAPGAQSGVRQKVIFHVGDADPAKWTVAFNNVFNVRKELGPAAAPAGRLCLHPAVMPV